MRSTATEETGAALSVRNIGGIEETTVTLIPGVNVLEGRNATNRTSFLRSIMAALGSDNVALKGDATEGRVELTLGGETYTRTFTRDGQTVTTDGDPYLKNSMLADLFSFLLENNDTRRAVERGDDLRDVIMRPVDLEEVESQIRTAEDEKSRLDQRLSELQSKKQQLPKLKQNRSSIERDLEEKRKELADVEAELGSLESGVDETRKQRDELESRLADLNQARSQLKDAHRRLNSERDQYEALKDERGEIRDEQQQFPTSVQEISNLGQQIGELQERKRTLDSLLDRLQNIIQFNREVMEDAESELREALVPIQEHVTDRLLAEDQNLVCWTCGSEVDRAEVEGTLEELQNLRQEKMAERKDIVEELEELRSQKQEIEQRQQRREKLEHRLKRIEDHIDQSEEKLSTLQEQIDEREAHVEDLENQVEELKQETDNEAVLDLNEQANKLERSIDKLESKLTSVEDEIEETQDEIAKIPSLEDKRATVKQRLTDLRNRVDDLEQDAVTAFNDHMERLIDLLGYDNLDRIWIERKEETVREGRRKVPKNTFTLHVVRSTGDGVAYEDTVDHLSESEREVTGLVFALAGYLVHDVHETVPFMLLDSLEAIDSERIAALVDYFAEYADFLVVALLPEDAQTVDNPSRRITKI